jgi:hypothetical protein
MKAGVDRAVQVRTRTAALARTCAVQPMPHVPTYVREPGPPRHTARTYDYRPTVLRRQQPDGWYDAAGRWGSRSQGIAPGPRELINSGDLSDERALTPATANIKVPVRV